MGFFPESNNPQMPRTVAANFPTQHGYMTRDARRAYITAAVDKGLLPKDAQRMAGIVSLKASNDPAKPIQFWQLFSVLGEEPIVRIVQDFYQRVFQDEPWFVSVFEAVGPLGHHINTQASMWADVMGGGPYYHGADFRLHFHHTHNAMALMNVKGAERWIALMNQTLDTTQHLMTDDPRVRIAINTFLAHFMAKYETDFDFTTDSNFGPTNPPYKERVNFMRMTAGEIAAMPESEIAEALSALGVDVSQYKDKAALLEKALIL